MAKKSETYENLLVRLEEIVSQADKEGLTLQESMNIYEEGIKICNKLYKVLNEAEGKIKILADGEEKDFVENKE